MQPIQTDYIALAQDIQATNNLASYNKLSECLGDLSQIEIIFTMCDGSNTLLFIATTILSRKLINRQIVINEDEFDTTTNLVSIENKKQLLLKISRYLFNVVLTRMDKGDLPDYVVKTCLNTISLCMKCTLVSSNTFDKIFFSYLEIIVPEFHANQSFVKGGTDAELIIIYPSPEIMKLPYYNRCSVYVLNSLLEYITNSTYFQSYYSFRRNIYAFRNTYLAYFLNYAIFNIKVLFQNYTKTMVMGKISAEQNAKLRAEIQPVLKLLENVVMYPFNLNMHEGEIQDEIHENIAGLQSEIYFPSYFRNFLCDSALLMNLVQYYSLSMGDYDNFDSIREDVYSLVRILGRCMSTTEYVFCGEDERRKFRSESLEIAVNMIIKQRFLDSYLIMNLSKINVKIVKMYNDSDFKGNKSNYYNTCMNYILRVVMNAEGKIEDGDKNPIRQAFDWLSELLINSASDFTLETEVKICSQDILETLFKRLTNNAENEKMLREFGVNNSQEVECFQEIFAKVEFIFKINLQKNLATLKSLDIDQLNKYSVIFWLHLCSLLLPHHDTSIEQTQLIVKFFRVATENSQTIASLHYIQTLITQILAEVQEGVSSTYLWKFMENSLSMDFENFLTKIISYTVNLLMEPNYTLIENALELFKAMFTKLCKYRHRSFHRYYKMVEEVSKKIDQTMLVHPDYLKLRIHYFSVISMIWITEGQLNFVYTIVGNIRQSIAENADYIHFLRYLTDLTGILEPVQSSEIFKVLVQLILFDMESLLPFYLGTAQKIHNAFSEQFFLKTFIKFLLVLVNDHGYRLSFENHTNLPLRIEETFRPFLIQALEYDYPKKTVQVLIKFIKLNPLSELLPLKKSLKQKNSYHYSILLREYFENLHRLKSEEQFVYMYEFIDGNVEFMSDWWEEVMNRDLKLPINVKEVANSHFWSTSRQKQQFARLLFRIAKYDSRYYVLEINAPNETKYGQWFVEFVN